MKLRTTLEELASGCLKYVAITKNSLTGAGTGKTKLDKERMKLCEREIVITKRFFTHNFATHKLYFFYFIEFLGSNWEYGTKFACISDEKFHEGTLSNGTNIFAKAEILSG